MAFPPPPKSFKDLPPAWADWFRQLRQQVLTPGGTVSFNSLDFTGSNITSIATRTHNSLQTIQGGASGDYQHLTTSQAGTVSSLNGLGSNGFVKKSAGSWVLDTSTYLTGNQTVTLSGVISGSGATSITTSINDEIDCIAGTTTKAPIKLQSGTNLTTATAGALEYDGKVIYSTHAANERGISLSEQFITLTSPYVLASQTGLQQIFNSSTNGTITLAGNTTYMFEGLYVTTGHSSTSGNVRTGFGGTATLASITYTTLGVKNALGSVGTAGMTTITSTSASQVVSDSINTSCKILIKGKIIVTTGGTFIPQIGMSIAAAAQVEISSYFRIWPVGSDTVVTVGNWS